jgi:hypothetical protein
MSPSGTLRIFAGPGRCLLLGVKRTSLEHRSMSASDPKQTHGVRAGECPIS